MNGDVVIGGHVAFTCLQISQIRECFHQVSKNGEKISSLMNSTVGEYFEAGEIIYNAIYDFPVKNLNYKTVAEATGLSPVQVSNALKVYKHFKDNPKLIDNLTMKDAISFICGKDKADGKPDKPKIVYNEPSQLEFDWEQEFLKPTISKLELQSVRFENPDNLSFWILHRGSNHPVKYCEFYADPPKDPVLKIEHDNMMKEIQASLEKYFKAKEDQEGMTCQG